MLLLLNSTKTMNLNASVPSHVKATRPRQLETARLLAGKISRMNLSQLADQMSLSPKLARETMANAALWGQENRPKIPALFGFTGLLYKSLDPVGLDEAQLGFAQKNLCILSGLYGVLRPLDLIEAYRLEMGQKLASGNTKNLAEFWKEILTARLNEDLKPGEPIVSLAAQEYNKALDLKKLKGQVILPVFKEQHEDNTLKAVVVHSKKAKGELVRYALKNKAKTPMDLMGFNALGWEPAHEPPDKGPWLFTRPKAS